MATKTEIPLAVGVDFWALHINGHYGAGGHPVDFTIVGETKTLWRVRRTHLKDMQPFTIKKDMSDYEPISAEDAQKIIWMRTNARAIIAAVEQRLRSFTPANQIENFELTKQVASVIGYVEGVQPR